MLEIQIIRLEKDKIINQLKKIRNIDVSTTINEIFQLDEKKRATQQQLDSCSANMNSISANIGKNFKEGNINKANQLKQETGQIKEEIKKLKVEFVNLENDKRISVQDFAIGINSERQTHKSNIGLWYRNEKTLPKITVEEVKKGFLANPNLTIRTEQISENGQKTLLSRDEAIYKIDDAIGVVEGANLIHNEYGNRLFADFFFFITGFHGFHVFSGVVINIIIFFNVILGTYEKRGHYEMVEKVGLYWHFVDLVWVFVFTFFYLV